MVEQFLGGLFLYGYAHHSAAAICSHAADSSGLAIIAQPERPNPPSKVNFHHDTAAVTDSGGGGGGDGGDNVGAGGGAFRSPLTCRLGPAAIL